MRVLSSFFAIVLVMMMAATMMLVSAQSGKNICTPIKSNSGIINPSAITPTQLTGLTNRGQGSYIMAISPCMAGAPTASCTGFSTSTYLQVSNTTGCVDTFDRALGRPSVLSGGNGFSVTYGSSANSNSFKMTVLCSQTAGMGIVSSSKKFATTNNKMGGLGYMMVVQSGAACPAGRPTPPPAPPASKQCKPSTINGKSVTFNWAPQYMDLVDGFGPEVGFLFSPCKSAPSNVPSWIPGGGTCKTGFGFITRFSGASCDNWDWDIITDFSVGSSQVNISYASSKQPSYKAVVKIICMMGSPVLTSPGGNFRNVSNTFHFELGIQDLCGGQTWAPWTAPPRPASLSSSSSGNPSPSGGSGSNPSGGSGSMPSGGSGSMPSGGSGSMPSGGSGSSGMPSSGSGSSGMPSSGSGSSGDPNSGDAPSGNDPSGGGGGGGFPSEFAGF